MAIHLLSEQVINRLKAGEVVERPASVIKELIENAIDAQASHITIDIYDGGKELIIVQDDGVGIEFSDSELILARYATSKISTDEDLNHLWSYGFRWEALASIAEVSSITLETKTQFADIGFQIIKDHQFTEIKKIALPYYHGTKIMIRDLFANTPVRKKFLKSSQTEYFYCYQMCLDFALIRYDIHRTLKKNGKIIHDLPISEDIQSRVLQVFKKDRSHQLYSIQSQHNTLTINGVISDTTLTFWSNEYCKIYVNGRPIQDRALQKCIMDWYYRQIAHGEYPLAIIAIDISSELVDVNIHPRKLQVKFIDPGAIFQNLKSLIEETLSKNKIFHGSHTSSPLDKTTVLSNTTTQRNETSHTIPLIDQNLWNKSESLFFVDHDIHSQATPHITHTHKIVGQLWDSYIMVQTEDSLLYVDQHALAERIAFEKMKKDITDWHYTSSTLLHPISIQLSHDHNSEQMISWLTDLKFEISLRGDHNLIIYKVPDFLIQYHIDIEKVMRHLIDTTTDQELGIKNWWIEKILDTILATRSCKTSIKAGHKLSYPEMNQLIQDGFTYIPGSFVCQHGRPFCWEIRKKEIDTMFDR